MFDFFTSIPLLDWLALAWMIACWGGYSWYSESSAAADRGLVGISRDYRRQWAKELLARDLRVADAALIGNLMSTVSFYAQTTIYIIAGLFALLGTLDKVMTIAADLPFARNASPNAVELKLMVLLAIFILAYFKFTWSLRQFNLQTIMVGGAPSPVDKPAQEVVDDYAWRLGTVTIHAGIDFNRGIRAYYFGLATMIWMIQPWMFIAVSTGILIVLYRRDFASPICMALKREQPPQDKPS